MNVLFDTFLFQAATGIYKPDGEALPASIILTRAIPASAFDLSKSAQLPLSEAMSLGAAFSVLPELFGGIASSDQNGEVLYRAFDAAGNVLTPDQLQAFNDGSGLLGSMRINGSFEQARFIPVEVDGVDVKEFDPSTLFMAMALMQVNERLDAISEMQEKMFAYAKQRDHAKLVGAFKVLDELRENYRYNDDNPAYLNSRHQLVAAAWRDAENSMELQRERLMGMLEPLGLFHTRWDVAKRTTEMVEVLRDYQLSAYLYCYATLMDITLVGNFDTPYLQSVTGKMERYSDEYRDLYNKCADRIEGDAKGSLGSMLASGIGAASETLGNFIAATPVGDATPIDEALIGGSDALGSLVNDDANQIVHELVLARPGFMRPFIDEIEEMDRLHNQPTAIVVGNESVYVLPLEGLPA